MGKKKKSKLPNSAELRNVAQSLGRGKKMDLKSIKDKKLKREMRVQERKTGQALRQAALSQLLLPEEVGYLEAEEGERTLKFRQEEIVKHVDVASAAKHFSLTLPHHGPYKASYTTNGRTLLIGGGKGHVATFDWQTGKLGCEFHVRETVRDITWLHNRDYIAVAQKKYAYIYDGKGVELHRMKNHVNPVYLQYLPYHWLLASIGQTGYLKYHDVSMGKLLVELKTRLGQPHSMSQNPWNAIINLGHSNGTVSMWSPNMKEPLVKMLCHKGPVNAIAVDRGGRFMATCGIDKQMKIWDVRTYKNSLEYYTPTPGSHLTISQTGLLAVSFGGHIQVWKDAFRTKQKAPYMTHQVEGCRVESLEFANFEDVLGVGHSNGFTSLLIPGAGEANFDALEANPYENRRQKQENEVKLLLNKIQPELISLDTENIHAVATPTEQKQLGDLDDQELVLRFKMKGRNSAKRRFLRREKHMHDHQRIKIRKAIQEAQAGSGDVSTNTQDKNILDRFKPKDV